MSWIDVALTVEIRSLLGVKLGENLGTDPIRFDVSANLEEKDRRSGRIVISFGLVIRTKPSVVKYEVEGTATLTGKDELIDRMLEADPESKIPFVFHRIYQHVFTAMYMLASTMGTVYPPSDLLTAGPQGIPVKSFERTEKSGSIETAKKAETAETVETTTTEAAKPETIAKETPPEQPETSTTSVS